MTTPRRGQDESDAQGFALGSQHFGRRTAIREASFFLPYLKRGMSLLDCGCGRQNGSYQGCWRDVGVS